MIINDELYEHVWVSSDYKTVFCTEGEKEQYLNYLSSRKQIPRGMSIVLIQKKLIRPYPKSEIINASPEKLKSMIQ